MTQLRPSSQAQQARARPGWAWTIAAGAAAGVVAGLLCVALEVVTRADLPPRAATLWSAAVAGVLAGLLYGVLVRTVRHPVMWLWFIAVGIATVDSLLIAFVPFPVGRGPRLPFAGLTAPLRQLAALAGSGRLGTSRYPTRSLAMVTVVHYVSAVIPCLLVPRWAKLARTG